MKLHHATAFVLLILFIGCQPTKPEENPSDEKSFSSFSLKAADNPGLGSDVNGSITSDSVKLEVPAGFSRNSLIPTFNFIGQSVTPGNRIAQNFNNPVVYTIKAEDGSTKTFTVVCNARVADTTQMVVANWKVYKDSVSNIGNFYVLINGTPNFPTPGVYWGVPADYYNFGSNGIVSIFENNNSATSPYQVYPNGRLFINELSMYDTTRILTLDAANMTLYWTGSSPNGGTYARKLYLRK